MSADVGLAPPSAARGDEPNGGFAPCSDSRGLRFRHHASGAGSRLARPGAARAFTLILASQFLLAAVIDHFGFLGALQRPLGPGQLAGMGLVLAGVWLVIR